ncbi:hypothetical protein Sste5346_005473 [Sporothrix stenoceras]|uniref:VLRF1 domain-containing protein n=1 Tax=Sporothrix stenoceras TaxID=5173 RepID=A0ABR3Z451_9PEZI
MADRKEEFLRRPLYVFGLPADVLPTLTPVPKYITSGAIISPSSAATTPARSYTPGPSEATDASETGTETPSSPSLASTAPGEACALCNLTFASHADKRDHFKSDLHLFNLKQKLAGKPPVSEDEFERLVGTLDESISGSEWSESDSLSDLDEEEEDEENEDETKSEAGSTATTSTSTNVLASLLKKQAVLAEKKKRRSQKDDGDSGSDTGTVSVNRPKNRKQRQREAAHAASLQPLIWFSSPLLPPNNYFGAYRSMFTPEELSPPADPETGIVPADDNEAERSARILSAIHSRQLPPMNPPPNNAAAEKAATTYAGRHIFMCMIGGGHVAAMVIALAPRKAKAGTVPMNREATVLAHKTFHRYTTRRKQGGSQSANDAAKGAAHSAGSTLRRYNEQALVDDVRALLRDWKPLLDSADLLFVRASGTSNQRTLFGPYEGQVLQRNDPRLRSFPFNTRRPTQKEIMRCFIELTRLKVREILPGSGEDGGEGSTQASLTAALTAEQTAAATQQRLQRQQERKAAAKRAEEEETALMHTNQLQALARRSKVPALLAYLKANDLSAATYRFAPPDAAQHHHAPTLLHYAASQNAPALVSALLLRADADPTVSNGDGKTPFELAGDRPTRDAFRVARSESTNKDIDWDAARVPAAMTRADAEERDAREKTEAARKETERRRAEEARLKEEAAAEKKSSKASNTSGKRLVGVLKSAQEIREEESRGLTPEQRQRLERERRARAAEARLRQMQSS